MRVSVVVPTLITTDKQFAMTIQCIERARSCTKVPFKLIVVETGTNYLSSLCDIHIHEPVKTTATKSINAGFAKADTKYVVLLTNDVLVEDKWLECLLDCFNHKHDCGISTLATTQFNHVKHNEISEGIWFSVAMFPWQPTYFDESFVNSWDDTDFIMRQYLKGKRMYRNYNCVVHHDPGQTAYEKPDHKENFERNRKLFLDKYKSHEGENIYKVLVDGYVI